MQQSLERIRSSADNAHSTDFYVAHGRQLAEKEGRDVFRSIDGLHTIEGLTFESVIAELKARGKHLVQQVQVIERRLQELRFDAAIHLRELAQGRVDLCWAVGLTALGAVLAGWSVSMTGASAGIVPLLALLPIASAASIEEFFAANHEKDEIKTGTFLALSGLTIAASYFQGELRGLLMMSINEDPAGPAGQALLAAGAVLRHTLGIFTVVAEIVGGWKWFEARRRLLSARARAYKKQQILCDEIVVLHKKIKAVEVEPEIRREYRAIGARQFLAQAAKPVEENHLRKAAIGALIALLLFFGLLFLVRSADAAPLPRQTVVGVDLSRSSTPEDIGENVRIVEKLLLSVPTGQRFLVLGITDAFGRSQQLLDVTFEVNASGLQLQAARERAVAQWRKTAAWLRPEYNHTAIVDTLEQLSFMTGGKNLDLYLLTDGREDTQTDIEHVPVIDVQKSMKHLTQKGLVPSLAGTRVHMLGVGVRGKTSAYVRSLRSFWQAFFLASGARLETFQIDRTIPVARQR